MRDGWRPVLRAGVALALALAFALAGWAGCSSGSSGTLPHLADAGTPDVATGDSGPNPDTDGGYGVDTGNGSLDSSTDAPEGGDAAPPCDPLLQTGCPTTDECTLNPGPVCELNGTRAQGQVCGTQSMGNCVRGTVCISDSVNGTDLCHQFCATDADCDAAAAASGSTAEPGNVGHCTIGLPVGGYEACTVPCNPVTAAGASGCPAPTACTYTETSTIPELTNCGTPGAGADGASCTSPLDCAAGLGCADFHHCRTLCRAGLNTDCPVAGDTCIEPMGASMFGFCCPAGGC